MAIKAGQQVAIYALCDPASGEVRYVGKTTSSLHRRLRQHVTESRRYPHLHKSRWIASLGEAKPLIRLIEMVPVAVWEERERFWISQFDSLTNHAAGGAGAPSGRQCSAQHVRAVADRLRGRIAYEKQGERNNGARLSEAEVREIRRLSAAGMSNRELAAKFVVTTQNVWLIVTGRAWRHISTPQEV